MIEVNRHAVKPVSFGTNAIPKKLIQTYHTNEVHPRVAVTIDQMLLDNPEYTYDLITDEAGAELIRTHFDQRVLCAFQKLKVGAAKGDFLRYVAMYIYGGVYIDMDSTC